MAIAVRNDAPVLDRLVTLHFADGYYNNFGEWQQQTRDSPTWACRMDLKVDTVSTPYGELEAGGAVYLIRWLNVRAGTVSQTERTGGVAYTADARPAIVALTDDIGCRNVYGVEEPDGYRQRYLMIRCAGTRRR